MDARTERNRMTEMYKIQLKSNHKALQTEPIKFNRTVLIPRKYWSKKPLAILILIM